MSAPAFPLSAIVGQDELVRALLVNAVAPNVGGLLVRGERGTAKSTAVRALAPLLPPVTATVGQALAFAPGELSPSGPVAADAMAELRPAPLVELPLGATLDRLVGSLDLAKAFEGTHAFEPGLLARAHQGILYVDEVNLLPDHLVDALLDAASSGIARVERDALSAEHVARFQLVGTMNAEEGELRPQLLDRFGLSVEVSAAQDPSERAEVVRRQLAFDGDPDGFARTWDDSEEELRGRIAAARDLLGRVVLPERELRRITAACATLGIDGVRGDIACARTARALAALDGDDVVDEDHVRQAARLALSHRMHRDPIDNTATDSADIDRALDQDPPDDEPPSGPGEDGASGADENGGVSAQQQTGRDGTRFDPRSSAPRGAVAPVAAALPLSALAPRGAGRGPSGRRAPSRGPSAGSIDSRSARAGHDDISVIDTLVSRIVHGDAAGVREHVRSGREGVLLCLVVDASGSMGARRRLARVKGALLTVLRDAYTRRDRVATIAFRDGEAEVLVPPGAPLERAAAAIRDLPAGGRTPLAAALERAERLIRDERIRSPHRRTVALVLTDGRSSDEPRRIAAAARRLGALAAVHVIDAEDGPIRLGLAGALAAAAGGQVHSLDVATPSVRSAA